MKHDWRTIPGLENYEVTSDGDVRNARIKRIKKQRPDAANRPVVTLSCPDGKVRPKMVHRLVAEAFLGPMPQGLETCHRDGDKTNCRLGNLRYGTKASNEADKLTHGTSNHGERNGRAKLTAAQVVNIRSDPRKARPVAQEHGIGVRQVLDIRRGAAWRTTT